MPTLNACFSRTVDPILMKFDTSILTLPTIKISAQSNKNLKYYSKFYSRCLIGKKADQFIDKFGDFNFKSLFLGNGSIDFDEIWYRSTFSYGTNFSHIKSKLVV